MTPQTWLTKTFNIKYPIILAPMFLVSNNKMLIAAAESGIMGCIPALNWRTPEQFEEGLDELHKECLGPFGINLIVNKSNVHLDKQIAILEKKPVAFIITSLGSPEKVITKLKPKGVKVFCDVVDSNYAKKVESLGADALIAVNSGAGGHAGPNPASILIPKLLQESNLPIINAGGVGTGSALLSSISLGAQGCSIGSPFIASTQSGVNDDYKDAAVKYGANDIVLTSKVSGTPCTVINTPYVQKIGTDQNFVESFLNNNKKLKKYAKMLTYYKGMNLLEKAAFSATYKSVWCAGPSIEFSHKKEPTKDIVDRIINEYIKAYGDLLKLHG